MTATESTNLQTAARSLLDATIHTITFPNNNKFTFSTPGLDTENIIDSTPLLLSARTLSKLGSSEISWQILKTLFAAQSSNGFIPRFVYPNETYDHGTEEMGEFIGIYPGPKLFPLVNEKYVPRTESRSIWSSNTLMAPPFHATTILETFYLSNQTNADVDFLHLFYDKLKAWHSFLHKRGTSKCIKVDYAAETAAVEDQKNYFPCLVVNHPWETELDMTSPIWHKALSRLKDEVAIKEWTVSYEIPDAAKTSFDYPGDEVHNSLIYLLECLSNSRHDDEHEQHTSYDHIQSACPFAMIDVGFTAALAKSDQDLRQIAQILMDKNRISHLSQRELELAESRAHISKQMLTALWSEESGTFFNRVVDLEKGINGTYGANETTVVDLPVGYNFMALWASLVNSTMVERMSPQLLQQSGRFSFACGDFPLWTIGQCPGSDLGLNVTPSILPLLNYRVSAGLKRNNDVGLGQFIQRSTLNLICGTPNSDESDLTNCSENLLFASAFNASTRLPLGKGACGLTSTATASIVLDLLTPDKKFHYASEPPISSSSVIFLIAIEMMLALGIGLICLFLSLNLVRRANADEEGDTFFHIASEQSEDGEQELLVQSPHSHGVSLSESFEEGYNYDNSANIWSWHALMSRLNPMNILRE